jgi:Ser/Thr protein kinase RdoA (MazF antagonist)
LTVAATPGILSRVPDGLAEFSSATAIPVLAEACSVAGLSSDGAELLRLGENAIYRLGSAPVVVRIARSADRLPRVEKELCVARWLAAAGIPAVHVQEDVEQPLTVGGHPVSFWRTVTGGDREPTQADLAQLLAAFHLLRDCPCDLPTFDPLGPSALRLARARGVAPVDLEFLRTRCTSLTELFRDLTFALPVGPIHGDAHTGNLLVDAGQVVLSDFESSAIGPREWDLLPTAIAVERYGLAGDRYRQFAGAYGFDVRGWSGYPVLREIRELTMTTWIMQNVGESSAIADEFARRVGSLRDRDFERAWKLF